MLRKILLSLLPFAAIAVFTSEQLSDNGKSGATGSPGEVNCTNCHNDFTVNTGPGSISIQCATMPGLIYSPGMTYNMSVTVAENGVSLFGVGIEALTSANDNAGTLTITDAAATQIKTKTVSGIIRRNVVHQLNGGANPNSKVFNFDWTAPVAGTGPITFYFSGIAADGDAGTGNDNVYVGSQVIADGSVGVNTVSQDMELVIYPNPVTDFASVNISTQFLGSVFTMYNMNGQVVKQSILYERNNKVDFSSFGVGTYIAVVEKPGMKKTSRISIVK